MAVSCSGHVAVLACTIFIIPKSFRSFTVNKHCRKPPNCSEPIEGLRRPPPCMLRAVADLTPPKSEVGGENLIRLRTYMDWGDLISRTELHHHISPQNRLPIFFGNNCAKSETAISVSEMYSDFLMLSNIHIDKLNSICTQKHVP